jgi:hypothetical protein
VVNSLNCTTSTTTARNHIISESSLRTGRWTPRFRPTCWIPPW